MCSDKDKSITFQIIVCIFFHLLSTYRKSIYSKIRVAFNTILSASHMFAVHNVSNFDLIFEIETIFFYWKTIGK